VRGAWSIALIVVSAATAEASPRGQSATPAPPPAAAAAPGAAAADACGNAGQPKKRKIEDAGLKIDFEWSQVLQDMLRGEAHEDAPYGGKLDLLLTADLSKIGFWHGLSVTRAAHVQLRRFSQRRRWDARRTDLRCGHLPGEQGGDRFDLMSLYLTQVGSTPASASHWARSI